MTVKAIPEGYQSITPSLTIEGAAEAIEFYKKAFGAEERMRIPGPGGAIMHAELQIGSSVIMIHDANPEWNTQGPKGLGGSPVGLYLYVTDVDAIFKQAIAAGATETQPVCDMFWGDRLGGVADPYGHQWTVATHKQDLSPDEIAKGQEAWMASMQTPQ